MSTFVSSFLPLKESSSTPGFFHSFPSPPKRAHYFRSASTASKITTSVHYHASPPLTIHSRVRFSLRLSVSPSVGLSSFAGIESSLFSSARRWSRTSSSSSWSLPLSAGTHSLQQTPPFPFVAAAATAVGSAGSN